MKILYWLYKSRINTGGQAPIMMRITCNGQRISFSTNIFTTIRQWDRTRQRIKGMGEQPKQLNGVLEALKSKAWETYAELLRAGQHIEPKAIKLAVTEDERPMFTLLFAINEHIAYLKKREGIEFSSNTIKKYVTLQRKIRIFLHCLQRSDIPLIQLKASFVEDWDTYMRKVEGLSHNGAAKNIQQLKRVIKSCLQKEWLQKDPLYAYRCIIKPRERGYLTAVELDKLMNHRFTSERLQRVADVFIFCCFTGLSYADVSKLTILDLENDRQGITWLKIARTKTGTMSLIPLLPIAQALLNKYHVTENRTGFLLPVISNQNLNKYLKEVAVLLSITKRLSMHLARHTFATTVTLEKGVDIATVSRMLGHKDIRTTQIYSKVTKIKIADDMKQLLSETDSPMQQVEDKLN